MSFNLIQKVDGILHEAELQADGELLSIDKVKESIQQVCSCVADTFQCLETSVLLEDRLNRPEIYSLVATIWPWPERFNQEVYRKGEERLTG